MQHPYTCRKNNIILFWPPPPSLPPPLVRSLILSRILLTRAHVSAYIYTRKILYTYEQFPSRVHGCVCVSVYVHANIVLFACLHIYVMGRVCKAALKETTNRSLVNSRFLPPSFSLFCTHARQAINGPYRIYTQII